MKRLRVSIGISLVLSLSLVITYFVNQKSNRARLWVGFVAITNNIHGTNMAIFSLSNTGHRAVDVADPTIELRNTPVIIGGGLVFRTVLRHSNQAIDGEGCYATDSGSMARVAR